MRGRPRRAPTTRGRTGPRPAPAAHAVRRVARDAAPPPAPWPGVRDLDGGAPLAARDELQHAARLLAEDRDRRRLLGEAGVDGEGTEAGHRLSGDRAAQRRVGDPGTSWLTAVSGMPQAYPLARARYTAKRALEHRAERHPVRPRRGRRAGRVAGLGARDDRLVLGDGPAARQLARRTGSRRGAGAARAAPGRARPRGCRTASTKTCVEARRRRGRPRGGRARAARRRTPRSAARSSRTSRGPRRGTASSVASPCTAASSGHDLVHVADASAAATRVKRCGAVSTRPSSRRRLSASRTGVRLRPSQPHSSSSCSGSPGARVPSTIASQSLS